MTSSTGVTQVPEGWRSSTLGELCDVITDGTHHTPKYVARGVPFYSVESVTNDDFVNVKYISEEEHKRLIRRCRPQRGDILMTRIGSLADTKYLDWEVDASIYVSLALLRPGRSLDGRYLFAYTKSRQFIKAVEDRSLVWAIPKKINMGDIAHVPVVFPSSQEEQLAIANAVFQSEDQVSALSLLSRKKREIRAGIAQQLLSGATRLGEFTQTWNNCTLGELADIKTGSRNNQDKKLGGHYPFFVRSATVERIDSYSYDCEAILIPGEGGIGSIFHYINGKFEVHQRVYKISNFRPTANGRFIYHYLRQFFGAHAMEHSVKATVDSLRLPTFKKFTITLPPLEEQLAIVEALDAAERDVIAVEARLAKARAVAEGVMQELLTGRTRLPAEAAS